MDEEFAPKAWDFLGNESTQLLINQMLISLVLKGGGDLVIPVSEIDATGGCVLTMDINTLTREFILHARKAN